MEKSKIKNQKLNITKFCLLFPVSCLLFTTGCGKKQPIGYEIVKEREGEIKNAFCEIFAYSHQDTLEHRAGPLLFAGKDTSKKFEAISFVKFEFDSAVKPETLWITGEDSGRIEIFKIDSINIDSLVWNERPDIDPDIDSVSLEFKKDTVYVGKVYVGGILADSDSVFYLQFSGNYGKILSFYDYDCLLSIQGDTLNNYKPKKSAYIDTSYLSAENLPDSLVMVQTGGYTTLCTLYVNLFIIDSLDTIKIDSLTDSLRTVLKLDSATVNKAIFKIPIDTGLSYEDDISVYPEYDSTFCLGYKPVNDTLCLYLESIVAKWFKPVKPTTSEPLWFVLRGSSPKISRVAMSLKGTIFCVTYTLPLKERK